MIRSGPGRAWSRALLLAFVCVCAMVPPSVAQRTKVDSLRSVLVALPGDSSRAPVLKALYQAALRERPDTAFVYAQAYLHLVEELGDGLLRADGQNMVGTSLTLMGKHDEALAHYIEALQGYEALGRTKALALMHGNVANAYANLRDMDKAVRHYRSSIQAYARSGLPAWEGGMAQELARLYRNMDALDSAEFYFAVAAERLSEVGGTHAALVRYEQAGMRVARGDHHGALPLYRQALNELGERGDALVRMEMTMALGNTLSQAGVRAEALEVLQDAMRSAVATGSAEAMASAYKLLADHHDRYGEHAEAYTALRTHMQWRDSTARHERTAAVLEIQERFGARELELELLRNKAFMAEQETRFRAVLISAVLAALAGLSLYVAYRHRQRALADLANKNTELDRSVQEKELLLRELHHRVKNNLQTVAGLLRMQMRGITDRSARDAIRDSQDRVRSMALIHQDLYHADDIRGVDMRSYVGKLASGLLKSHGVDPQRITLRMEVAPLQLDVDTAIPIGLILNELIVNALKYAFPAERGGTLLITLRKEEDGLLLEVADDGVGFSLEAVTGAGGPGFGLGMLRTFAEKLQADHHVLGSDGTTVRMRIRNYKLAS